VRYFFGAMIVSFLFGLYVMHSHACLGLLDSCWTDSSSQAGLPGGRPRYNVYLHINMYLVVFMWLMRTLRAKPVESPKRDRRARLLNMGKIRQWLVEGIGCYLQVVRCNNFIASASMQACPSPSHRWVQVGGAHTKVSSLFADTPLFWYSGMYGLL
jgi:hypothetical protein